MPPKRDRPNFSTETLEDHEMKIPSGINFNSLIGIIAVATIMWVGNKTSGNSESLTKIETQLPYVNSSVVKLEAQITQLVTRAELEGRFAEMAAKHSVLDKRLLLLEFEKKKPEPQ